MASKTNAICTVINNDYIYGGIMLLYSLKYHDAFNNDIIIFYSSIYKNSDLDKKNRDFIEKHFPTVKIINVKDAVYKQFEKKYSKMMSAFLCLEAFLNKSIEIYDKICFLDCDMLVVNNIDFIFEKMDNNRLNGSCNQLPHYKFIVKEKIQANNINTGFMLYNRKLKNTFSDNIFKILGQKNLELPNWDQSIVNMFINNTNLNNHLDWFCNYKPSPQELIQNKWNIIHYTGQFKPWNCFGNRSTARENFEMNKHIIYKWFEYVDNFMNEINDPDEIFFKTFLNNRNMEKIWNDYKSSK